MSLTEEIHAKTLTKKAYLVRRLKLMHCNNSLKHLNFTIPLKSIGLQILLVFSTHDVWAQDSVRALKVSPYIADFSAYWLAGTQDSLFVYNWEPHKGNPSAIKVYCRRPLLPDMPINLKPNKVSIICATRSFLDRILLGKKLLFDDLYTEAQSHEALKLARKNLRHECFGYFLATRIDDSDTSLAQGLLQACLEAENICDPVKYVAALYVIAEEYGLEYQRIEIYFEESCFLIYEGEPYEQ